MNVRNYESIIKKDLKKHWFYAENLPFNGNAADAQAYGQKFGLGVECHAASEEHYVLAKFFGNHDQLLLLLSDFFGRNDAALCLAWIQLTRKMSATTHSASWHTTASAITP